MSFKLNESRSDYIFVYGTLRKELHPNRHELIAGYCDFVCKGTFKGQLYEINGYPGAIESLTDPDQVVGELYQTHSIEMVLKILDDYEECSNTDPQPHEYFRKRLPIQTLHHQSLMAWVYIYNRSVTQRTRIISGDYQDLTTATD